MDKWDEGYLDLVEPAFISYDTPDSAFAFCAAKGWFDVPYGT